MSSSNVKKDEWDDWRWQIKGLQGKENFWPPYYLNLCLSSGPELERLKAVQKFLFDTNENSLLLSDEELLERLKETRPAQGGLINIFLPWLSVLPQRIHPSLVEQMTFKGQAVIHLSINHPDECTQELFAACNLLADKGFILNNHMTLLKGVNDDPKSVKELNLKLLMMRIRPYSIYLFETRKHESECFNVSKEQGVAILESLRGWTSGLAVAHLLVEKETKTYETLLPNYIKKREGEHFIFRNYRFMDFDYVNE